MTPFLYLEPTPIRAETPFKLRYASLPGVPQAGKCVYAFPSRVRCKARINSIHFIILPRYHLSRLNCIFAFFHLQNAIFCHRPAVFFRKAAFSEHFRSDRAFCPSERGGLAKRSVSGGHFPQDRDTSPASFAKTRTGFFSLLRIFRIFCSHFRNKYRGRVSGPCGRSCRI